MPTPRDADDPAAASVDDVKPPTPRPGSPTVLMHESFDETEALLRWKQSEGARRSAGGPSGAIAWAKETNGGSIRFDSSPETASWPMLGRDVDIPPADGPRWLRLSGEARGHGLEPESATYANCNLFVRHRGGLVATPLLTTGPRQPTGDQANRLSRLVPVPPGTDRVTVGIFSSIPGTTWFDDIRLEMIEAPDQTEETAGHYRYVTLADDRVDAEARAFNEESFRRVSEFLDLEPSQLPAAVDYFKYPSRESKGEWTGDSGNAHRRGDEIHSIWATDRHEIVHVLAARWGDPPALLAEGLAVHLSGGWSDSTVRAAAAAALTPTPSVTPSSILDSASFRAQPDARTYPISGAFVEWLLETRGQPFLREAYETLANRAPASENASRLRALLGAPLDRVDADFVKWVRAPP
jgi:hypothetical protein